jgi:uncharacterized oligopeptide transporter (OPT) family protein
MSQAQSSPIPDLPVETAPPLPIEGFQGTPEEIERQWFERVYKGRGDVMPQLTWRAVLMGSVLGGVLSLTNIYIGLKAGWSFGVAITACILSYAIWTGLCRIGLAKTRMTILENNCMQSTASSAGYSTGGTLISAFAAYMILHPGERPLSVPITLAWVFFLAVLGVTMAVPMKRQMINIDQLRFPSGIAAAETLRALYSHGSKGMRAAKALGIAGLIAAIDNFWAGGLSVLDKYLAKWFHAATSLGDYSSGALLDRFQTWALGKDAFNLWNGRTVIFSWDAIFIAAGAITGMRVSLSMFVSGTLCWAVFVPILQHHGHISVAGGFRDVVQWTLWGGVACMVASSLFGFFLQWRSALRAFRGLGRMFSPGDAARLDEMDAIETPNSWFVIGQLGSLIALAWLAHYSFGMPYWQSALAVVLSFALALVACRVTGETDTTPMGAMGKVTQLIFGALNPGNINVNLMSANITSAAAGSSADLLTDLKSGYLLGAHPRKQFIAQFAGIFIGTIATVLAFSVIVPDATALGTKEFPAPAAQTWAAVAQALAHGLEALHPVKIWSIVVGGFVGLVLSILSAVFPRQQKYIPSASAAGLAWIFQWYYGLLFLLGALIVHVFQKKAPEKTGEFTFPIASGVIAGGSLMGVLLIFWENGPAMYKIFSGLFGGK